MLVGYETGSVSQVAVRLAGQVADQLTGGLITQLTEPVRRWFQEEQNKLKFKFALNLCLDALYASDYAIEGPGAIDEGFLCNKEVCQELWSKLLDPRSHDEIDTHKLVEVYNEVWEKSSEFSDSLRSRQHEAIDFLVSVLYDEILWQFPQFVNMLDTRILRRLDTWVSPRKRRFVIERYLQLALTHVQSLQQELMDGGKYIEPIIQKFEAKPEREEQFRQLAAQKWGPAQEFPGQFKEVDINEYFLGEPDGRIMIIADSGYGKTTLLQELMLRAAKNWRAGQPVPFFFSPNQAASCREQDLRTIIFERLAAPARLAESLHVRENQLRAIASELKDKGELFLLFDALDQITDPQSFLGYLEGTSLARNQTVVSARPSAWEAHKGSLRGYALLRLVEFDRKRIEAYFGELLKSPQLRELTDDLLAIPILASLIRSLLTQEGIEVGRIVNRSDLYCKFIHKLPTREQDRRILGNRKPEDALGDLQMLASETLRKGYLAQFPPDVAKEIIEEDKFNTLERLQFVLKFLETGDLVAFRHRSFQEYLAAEVLLREWSKSISTYPIEKYLFHPNWEKTVTFIAGLIKDTEQLEALLDLILHPKGNPLLLIYYDHLRLACSCLHEARVRAPHAIAKVLARIDELMLTDVQTALSLLADWGRDNAEERLINALKDADGEVCRYAASALCEIGSGRMINRLIEALKGADEGLRWYAASALGGIGSERTITALIEALKDAAGEMRWSAASALGKIGSERTITALIEALKDADGEVRWSAVSAQGEIGSKEAIGPLIEALKGADKVLRWSAAGTLGEIGSERSIDALIEALKDADEHVRRSFNSAMGEIGSEESIDVLIETLNGANEVLRWSFNSAMGKIGSEQAIGPLIEALKGTDKVMRWSAGFVLGKIGSEQAIGPLIEALKDADEHVRRSAACALIELNSARVLEAALVAYECPEFIQARAHLLDIIKAADRALRAQRSVEHD